jgi:PadR family transcriptional regulator, regulatory protein PadR
LTLSFKSRKAQEAGVPKQVLGEFEQMVLLAVVRLRDGAYGVPIVEEIEARTGRTVAPASVHVTLRRLEEKGLVTSWLSEPVPERGGRARRCVRVEPEGLRQLREARSMMDALWSGVELPGGAR